MLVGIVVVRLLDFDGGGARLDLESKLDSASGSELLGWAELG